MSQPPPPPQFGQPAATPQWTGPPLASWGQRATGALIDWVAPTVVLWIAFYALPFGIAMIVWLAAIAFHLWNWAEQGRTGQTIGKKQAGIRCLREQDGQVIGVGNSIGRGFVHIIDAVICYIGFLFPLWDPKRQTIADKIMRTVVIVG